MSTAENMSTASAIESYTPSTAGRANAGLGTPKQRAANNDDGYRRLAALHIPVALTDAERADVATWLRELAKHVMKGFGAQSNVKATRWVKGERPT